MMKLQTLCFKWRLGNMLLVALLPLIQLLAVLESITGEPVGTSSIKRLIAAQVGAMAVPYLSAAPYPLIVYLISSYTLAFPVLLLLTRSLRYDATTRASNRELLIALGQRFACWALLYLSGGALVVRVLAVRSGLDPVLSSWSTRLALYGLLTTLPLASFVFGTALSVRRLSRLLLITCIGAASCGVLSSLLVRRGIEFPTPILLRAELFSGKAELVFPCSLGLVVWSVSLLLAGLGIRARRVAKLNAELASVGEASTSASTT